MDSKRKNKQIDVPTLRRLLRDQMAGYARANEFILAEKQRRLVNMTAEESREIFDTLCDAAEHALQQNPSWGMLEEKRLKDTLEYRRIFNLIGKRLAEKDE